MSAQHGSDQGMTAEVFFARFFALLFAVFVPWLVGLWTILNALAGGR